MKAEELTKEELIEIAEDYNELVWWLHNHDQEIGMSPKLLEDYHDMVYRRLEP